jgi:iron(III) transport system permease protein
VGGALSSALGRREQPLLLLGAGAVLVVASAVPLATLLGEVGALGPQALRPLASARPWALLFRSVALAGSATTLALAIGTPLGVLVARSDLPWRRALWVVHAFPLFLPPFLVALGWFHLFGRDGLLGGEATAGVLFSPVGLVLMLAVTFAPVVTSLVAVAVLGIDASLEEAARVVASPWRVATRILVPAARPALALAAIVVFALSISELGVPMFLRVDVFPAAVFARLGGVDYAPGEAFALVLPLVPIALGLLVLERKLVGPGSVAVRGLRRMRAIPLPLGSARRAMALVACVVAALSIAPIAALVWSAAPALTRVSEWLGDAVWTSLLAAGAAAAVISAVGLVLGHASARQLAGARWLDGLAVLAFVMPASVLGVGLISAWNRPATAFVYGTMFILVVGFVARYAVIGIRVIAASVQQMPVQLEEAAATCGAAFARRLLLVVLPVNARGVGFALLMAVVFCLRDLETSVLFYPPGGEPLTVRIFTLEANGAPSVVAALSVVHVGLTVAVVAFGAHVLRRRRG